MSLAVGSKIGQFEILSPLGAGGMGEVYCARDTKLNRDVALKVLPAAVASDADRMARFRREAQVLASLNHPNIAAIYGLEDSGGVAALVMELVEGETLAARIGVKRVGVGEGSALPREREALPYQGPAGPIPLDEALPIAKQIAEALESAHERGIIHRDLKPQNIKITPEGTVKVLDFGLAKALDPTVAPVYDRRQDSDDAAHRAALQHSPTLSAAATQAGVILGTAAYMSPEQAKGKSVDRRTDIWAFGCVLYEMLAGQQAFQGETVTDVLAGVLKTEPEWKELPATTPPAIQKLIRRCLSKDPKQRLRDIGEARFTIEETLSGAAVAPVYDRRPEEGDLAARRAALQPFWRRVLPWALAAVSLLVAAFLAIGYLRRAPEGRRAIRSHITTPEKLTFAFMGPPTNGAPALSPDGSRMVFPATDAQGKEALWVRPMDSFTIQRLDGTTQGIFPFWSPDSHFVGFFQGGKLKKIDVAGGPALTICDAPAGRGGTWNRDDVIIFAPEVGRGLSRVSASGGTPTRLSQVSQSAAVLSYRWPVFLPDGRHYMYWAGDPFATDPSTVGIYLSSLDSTEKTMLVPADSNALYAPPGYLLFLRERSLMAQPFDAASLKLKGDAFPIAELVASPQNYRLGLFSVSQNGLLVYQTGKGALTQFAWYDANGKSVGNLGDPGTLATPHLSPDGKRMAYVAEDTDTKNIDIWLLDLERGVRTRFTFNPSAELNPVWSPDGSRIVFASQRKAYLDMYVKDSSGAGNEELLLGSEATKRPTDWSRDGRYLCFSQFDSKSNTNWDIWMMPMFGDRKPFPYLQTPFSEGNGSFSPDGHWLAYQSDESGTYEIYVAPFPGGSGKFQVSQGGGAQPTWKRDGTALFYMSGVKLMEASLRFKGSAVEIGTPHELMKLSPAAFDASVVSVSYAVSPDAKRFLLPSMAEGFSPEPLTLVTNWTADVKR